MANRKVTQWRGPSARRSLVATDGLLGAGHTQPLRLGNRPVHLAAYPPRAARALLQRPGTGRPPLQVGEIAANTVPVTRVAAASWVWRPDPSSGTSTETPGSWTGSNLATVWWLC